MPPLPLRRHRRLAAALVALALAPLAAQAGPVAQMKGAVIEAGELDSALDAKRLELERLFQTEFAAMKVRYERAQARLRESTLDQLIDERLVSLEASATHRTPEAVEAEAKPVPPTEQDARALFEREKANVKGSFDQWAPAIYDHLREERAAEAKVALHERLRAKYHARALIEPLRATVEPVGPSRGPASARVTIVEFADFECPFCARARGELAELQAAYPADVRLVVRQLPLADIHPHAQAAAEASLCADEQGRFWAFHDTVYAAQDRMGPEALRAAAIAGGADGARYDECLASGRVRPRIEADVAAAQSLAVDGTPGLFINGRFLSGAPPLEKLKALVAEELQRHSG